MNAPGRFDGADTSAAFAGDSFEFPASFAQQRLWLIDQLEPGTATYNVPYNLRLTGPLDHAALERSFGYLMERHEALRTVFAARDGAPVQVVLPPRPFTIPIIALDVGDADSRAAALERLVYEEGNRPFDLATGPLLRVTLARMGPDDHALLLTAHHVAMDGWSFGVLQREIGAAYDAFAAGRAPSLPELPIQYADFAVWQREQLQGERLAEHLAYWTAMLRRPLPVLDVPTDRPRDTRVDRTAGRTLVTIPHDVSERVAALSRAESVTPFMTLLTAYNVLLARYSGQDDIVVGTPIAGRTRTETEGLIGFFVNTLALRTDLSGAPTFRELLGRVRATTLGALAHEELPFERLVEAIQPERDRTRNPVFQAMFSLQDLGEAGTLRLGDIAITKIGSARDTAKFDLQLLMNTTPHGFRGVLEYDAELYDAATVEQMGRHFVNLLRTAVVDPDRAVTTLPLMDDAERNELLAIGRGAVVAIPSTATLHDAFAVQAVRTPDAVAVEFGAHTLTYRELDVRATALAARLCANGVAAGGRVAICLERSPDMAIAVLGVLKAGAAYVPIDPTYPPHRIALLLGNAHATLALTTSATATVLPPDACAIIEMGREADLVGLSTARAPDARENAENADVAYVIYTSGSTGTPKGVVMPHRPLVNLIEWQRDNSLATVGTRTLQFASLSFDVSCQEMFATWCTGGSLVLVPDVIRRDADALLAFIAEQRIERMFVPYIALQHLADAACAAPRRTYALREIITAGEQLRITPAIREWLASLAACTLVNQYGPTETHVVTAHALDGDARSWPELPPIGRAIANASLYVLDALGEPVPRGVSGELYLGGVPVARGYLDAPDRTAERFLTDPFAAQRDARMYRTGDIARLHDGGVVEYLGRRDDQIKLRGYRVELGEVESVLGTAPSVAACAVAPRSDGVGGQRLVAYVVCARDSHVAVSELRAFCAVRLPEFMVPGAFVILDALPLTPSGKVDRRALPDPTGDAAAARMYVAPGLPLEQAIAAIWSDVLRVERVGAFDNFFELGGHSLLATRMISRLRDYSRRDIPLRHLFDHPVLRDFATAVGADTARPAAMDGRINPVSRAGFTRVTTGRDSA